jgi:aspartyl-tRNA(Asn)/glutamyl-tRNA(Gln) amidotransferase subunit C
MSMASRIDPARTESLAELARLRLSAEESKGFAGDLHAILTYLGKIEELSIAPGEPAGKTTPGSSRLREDEVKSSLPVEQVRRSVPRFRDGFVVVPRILEE